jgi:hypothetical protein
MRANRFNQPHKLPTALCDFWAFLNRIDVYRPCGNTTLINTQSYPEVLVPRRRRQRSTRSCKHLAVTVDNNRAPRPRNLNNRRVTVTVRRTTLCGKVTKFVGRVDKITSQPAINEHKYSAIFPCVKNPFYSQTYCAIHTHVTTESLQASAKNVTCGHLEIRMPAWSPAERDK